MPRVSPLKSSANAGEFSPRLAARTDFSKFPNGQETVLNMIPLAEGGAMRRSGTRHVAEIKDSSVKGRVKRFEFSTTQAYMLEMGAGVIRFYRHQGQISVSDTDASITNGTFASDISGWTDQSNGTGAIAHDATNDDMEMQAAGSGNEAIAEQSVTHGFPDQEHVLKFRVKSVAGDTITVRVGSSSGASDYLADTERKTGYHCVAFTPTASPFFIQFENGLNKTVSIDDIEIIDDAGVEIDSPYAAADLFEVEGPQSADVLYLFHEDYATHKIERYGHTTWSLTEVEWTDGPYGPINETSTTLNPGASTGLGITVTASATTGINDGQGFLSTDVGRLLRFDDPASGIDWGYAVITAVASTTSITVDIKRDFAASSADDRWRLGEWSATTGYPSCGAFFEQRLAAAGTTDKPQTFWMSQTGDFENMSPDSPNTSDEWDGTVEDDDALDYTISADNVNAIRAMSPGQDTLVILTRGGEWVPSSNGAVLTPTDIAVRQQTSHGSARVNPVRVDHVVLFVQRAGRKLREFAFSFEADAYQAFDMTRLAQHITIGGITEMAFAEEPDAVVWAVRGDGQLLSMTYRREEDVVGWARHILGGSFSSGNAVVESVAVIPGADGAGQVASSEDRDEVWLIVKRTINGQTKRYIEILERDFEDGDDQEDAYYADSLITYDGAAATTITGLDHLEGETVKVWADGAIVEDKTVSSGSITLDESASVVQVGLGYTHRLKTLKMEGGAPSGTAIGKTKRIYRVTFVLLNSHTLRQGPTTSDLTKNDFRVVSDAMDTAVPLFTGEHPVEFEGDWDTDTRIVVDSDDPAPFTLLAIAPEVAVNDLA